MLTNSQVLGRTSPRLVDLLAALATGLAGAIAITRRDVGDVLPGVAIAISLVPPLGVVGVCLGSGAPSLAIGAFVLFASNVVAMVITSVVVLTVAGYGREAVEVSTSRRSRRRVYAVLTVALVVVAVPMVVNSLTSLWARQVATATQSWLRDGGAGDTEITGVTWSGRTVTVNLLGSQQLPSVDQLRATVDDLVPWNPEVVVVSVVGERDSAG